MVDLDAQMTQTKFAALVGVSQPVVSELIVRGVLHDGETAGEWLRNYCRHMREIAAGRATEGGIKLATERALLAREQRDKIAMQNAVTRGELAPRSLLVEVLAMTAPKVCGVLDSIVPALRRRSGYSAADLDFIKQQIALARNEIASMRLPDLKEQQSNADDDVDFEDAD